MPLSSLLLCSLPPFMPHKAPYRAFLKAYHSWDTKGPYRASKGTKKGPKEMKKVAQQAK